jgi:ABC-2 type transport system ATP-binding protein
MHMTAKPLEVPMIEARGLVKHYRSTPAVNDLSFDVHPGTVTGFLGPNGAGKSTTMRMIMGLDRPDAGQVRIDGKRYGDLRWPLREVGAMLEAKAFHPGRTARAHLTALAASNAIGRQRVEEVLAITGIEKAADRRAGKFSLGMSQRLGIAAALLGQGRLLAQTTVARLSARSGSLEEAFFQLTDGVTDYSGSL